MNAPGGVGGGGHDATKYEITPQDDYPHVCINNLIGLNP